jgi:hypothetical protein
VASQINEALPAGTGCQWCVPFVKRLHEQVMAGETNPDLPVSPAEYAKRRAKYRKAGSRD